MPSQAAVSLPSVVAAGFLCSWTRAEVKQWSRKVLEGAAKCKGRKDLRRFHVPFLLRAAVFLEQLRCLSHSWDWVAVSSLEVLF